MGYEWSITEILIKNYRSTMIHPLFKKINQAKRLGVSNLKYEIEKSTLSKFGSNVKDLIDEMSSNYSIIID